MSAPPVLLVHGFASSFEREWRQPGWVELLRDAGREVIGVDLLGHGTSTKPHDPHAYSSMDAELLRALDGSATVDAVGFSLGARLLLKAALGAPSKFNRLVLGGVGENLFRRDDNDRLLRAIAGDCDTADVTIRAFARFATAPGNDPDALVACLRANHEPLDPTRLALLDLPVLVVLGDRDFAGPAKPLIDALRHAELVELCGVDHLATPGDFGFIDAALRFLEATP